MVGVVLIVFLAWAFSEDRKQLPGWRWIGGALLLQLALALLIVRVPFVWDAIGEQFGQPVPEKSKEEKQELLGGMYLHTLNDGKINWQGHITAVEGDTVFVQLFSWLTGAPTNVETLTKDYVLGPDVRLYSSRDAWIERGDRGK